MTHIKQDNETIIALLADHERHMRETIEALTAAGAPPVILARLENVALMSQNLLAFLAEPERTRPRSEEWTENFIRSEEEWSLWRDERERAEFDRRREWFAQRRTANSDGVMYMALPADGVTDCTPALQELVDRMPPGSIYLPEQF